MEGARQWFCRGNAAVEGEDPMGLLDYKAAI